ncbi:MAG: hypothetical protein DRI48_07280 [Chloroflexi bacterium]|nr:MAG: hypothetical protein DRI48_07280 [Chloroflexota bacterium]
MDDLTETGAHPQKRGRRTVWLVLGGGLLLVLLVGAAFVGGKLLARQPPREDVEVVIGGGGEDVVHFGSPLERPKELPEEEPDVCGVVTRRDGNSLFLGKGAEPVGPEAVYEEPEVEVVVTHDTEIYRQTIEIDLGAYTTERTLEPATLDDITNGTHVQVWGEKRGDRVVARVLVCLSMGLAPRGE